MQSKAKTVTQYLAELPPDRRKAMMTVRAAIKKRLPKGYQETMGYGMMGYAVPLSRYPQGYLNNKNQPLPYIGLASQKNNMAVYLMCFYTDGGKAFRAAWKKTGKKLDMGKSCIRFKKVEDLALDVIGDEVAKLSVDQFIKLYEKSREGRKK